MQNKVWRKIDFLHHRQQQSMCYWSVDELRCFCLENNVTAPRKHDIMVVFAWSMTRHMMLIVHLTCKCRATSDEFRLALCFFSLSLSFVWNASNTVMRRFKVVLISLSLPLSTPINPRISHMIGQLWIHQSKQWCDNALLLPQLSVRSA